MTTSSNLVRLQAPAELNTT